ASRQAVNDNWVNGTGEWVWMNGTNELCWRDAFWTPATANAKCDGALVAQAPQPPVAPAAAPAISSQKITYQADALFDFDKATLKPLGKQKLDELASK
ncbi:OmpA family protein, partial [Achromobacter sp. SIMBA_011]